MRFVENVRKWVDLYILMGLGRKIDIRASENAYRSSWNDDGGGNVI